MADTQEPANDAPQPPAGATANAASDAPASGEQSRESHSEKKRKRFGDDGLKFGRGGKKRDMGRKDWQREQPDRRARNDAEKQKPRGENNVLPKPFAEDEIAAEDRRPKRKVAVLIGYSGTGYKGMQINTTEKTIEGDLFTAFVKAGAISKANADDPKKSQLVRCARTDKGVHAAGNMISLKLIIEDADIVQKINEHLSPQIRVWGIERTIGSFSCYQACDSRWYEYLLPSSALLPPHPSSWLAKVLEDTASEVGDREGYDSRQAEVKGFWDDVDARDIQPILAGIDEDIRGLVIEALNNTSSANADADADGIADADETDKKGSAKKADEAAKTDQPSKQEPATIAGFASLTIDQKQRLEAATKTLKQAYSAAKRAYRIPKQRVERLQEALTSYCGTRNYHNYTILKTFRDPSSKRMIKSFVVNPDPILINGTEWLSLKVHGQSFMMHQIRKMVGMASLVVRCGAPISRITESYGDDKFSIPKVPGLGLLLERPVFDSYNNLQAAKHGRDKLDFTKYETELEAFKQKEIYQRIFEEEARDNTFHLFFNQIDNYKERHFLYLTSKGIEATRDPAGDKSGNGSKAAKLDVESDDEAGAGAEEGG
ncbi:hypothetical protein MBLNU459_g4940t1 [Dothideomycetes sp. NU459]